MSHGSQITMSHVYLYRVQVLHPHPPHNHVARLVPCSGPTSTGRSPSISYSSAKFPNASAASPCFLLTSSSILKKFAKIALNHKIEEVVEIVVNCKIEEEVIWALGWDFESHFWAPFLGSIFAPFLVNSQSRICLFYGTFSISMAVLDPFWDLFWDVHLAVLLDFLGPGLLNRLHVLRRLANQSLVPLIQGSWMSPRGFEWRICTLLALAFAIFFHFPGFRSIFQRLPPHIPGFRCIFGP
jgi:hypothetical protein